MPYRSRTNSRTATSLHDYKDGIKRNIVAIELNNIITHCYRSGSLHMKSLTGVRFRVGLVVLTRCSG